MSTKVNCDGCDFFPPRYGPLKDCATCLHDLEEEQYWDYWHVRMWREFLDGSCGPDDDSYDCGYEDDWDLYTPTAAPGEESPGPPSARFLPRDDGRRDYSDPPDPPRKRQHGSWRY
jgi:hypothetical protein